MATRPGLRGQDAIAGNQTFEALQEETRTGTLLSLVWVLVLCFPTACGPGPKGRPPPAASYLDQPLPGDSAVVFAPGLISVQGRHEYGISFSPSGKEMLVSAQRPAGASTLLYSRLDQEGWTVPRVADLTGGQNERTSSSPSGIRREDGRILYPSDPR